MIITKGKPKALRKKDSSLGSGLYKKPRMFKKIGSKIMGNLGRIGKSLLFPIATLPIAAILLRIGSQLPTGNTFDNFVHSLIYNGGNVLFQNLHIVFAVGISFGMTRDNRGEAAMAGFIGIALMTLLLSSQGADLPNIFYKNLDIEGSKFAVANAEGFHKIFTTTSNDAYDAILGNNVLNGIVIGCLVAFLYNRFNGAEMPSVLGFFSGRRLIPVLTILSILAFSVIYALVFPWIGYGLYKFSESLSSLTGNRYSNAAVMGVYTSVNRLLIPFGLHHIPNTLFWFTLPVFSTAETPEIMRDFSGQPLSGDIFTFINGVAKDNPAGTFQTGFFPIMMFGLPALAAVFYVSAENAVQKRRVLAMFGSAALVTFLTGITEPIEFAFMFISPIMYLAHVILSGVFAAVTGLFGMQIGFGFSAGLLDYALSIPKSLDIIAANKEGMDAFIANPAWLIWVGAVTAGTYYGVGRFLVVKYNIATPGRGENKIESVKKQLETTISKNELSLGATKIVRGLGGWNNITNYQNCATRLRYDVKDMKKIDEKLIKSGGAMGLIKVSDTHIQIIIGPKVELLNNEIIANKGKPLQKLDANNQIAPVVAKPMEEKVTKKAKDIRADITVDIASPIEGKAKTLKSLNDGVFSEKMLGEGIVVEFGSKRKNAIIKSPISGKLVSVFPTGHAYMIQSAGGIEILIHIGIDTVKGEGAKFFHPLVKQGVEVKIGDPLVEVDVEELRKITPHVSPIILNTSKDVVVKPVRGEVKPGDRLFTLKRKGLDNV